MSRFVSHFIRFDLISPLFLTSPPSSLIDVPKVSQRKT